jgi:hypothetical protein
MKHQTVVPYLLGVSLLLNACTLASTRPTVVLQPTSTVVAALPTMAAMTPTPSITPTPPPPPTPAPSATPTPTLDPQAISDTIEAGQAALEPRGIDPLCLRWEDVNDDAGAEWLGLYLRPAERPRLEAFVLDGEIWHELRAMEEAEHGLGTYPTCEVDVSDINADGKVEILVYGHAEQNMDLLHIFAWNGLRYQLLASFQADAGLRVEDVDGKLSKEIIVRYNAGNGLAWETVHTWDGANYGWTWERYDWLYADHPHTYPTENPEHLVISFYLALDDRDLPGAYGLLSSETRSSQPYQTWAAGFDTTLAVQVGAVHQTSQAGDTATVTAQVRSYDNLDGYVVGRLWDTTWALVYEGQLWRLRSATHEKLDEWEAPYFP